MCRTRERMGLPHRLGDAKSLRRLRPRKKRALVKKVVGFGCGEKKERAGPDGVGKEKFGCVSAARPGKDDVCCPSVYREEGRERCVEEKCCCVERRSRPDSYRRREDGFL